MSHLIKFDKSLQGKKRTERNSHWQGLLVGMQEDRLSGGSLGSGVRVVVKVRAGMRQEGGS